MKQVTGRATLYALAILALAGAPVAVARADDAQSYEAKAKAQLDKGDLKGAEIELRNAAHANPNDPSIHVQLADIYLKIGNLPDAEAEARLAENGGAKDAADPLLAEALLRQNKITELLQQVKPGDRPNAEESAVRFVLGSAHLNLKELTEAEPLLRDAERLDDKAVLPKLGMVRLFLAKNDLASADEEIARARALAPGDPRVTRLMAELAIRKGDTEGALADLAEALKKDPNDAAALIARAQVRLSRDEFDLAKTDLDQVLKRDKHNLTATYLEAYVAFKKKDAKHADDLLSNVNINFSNYPEGYLLQGAIKYALGQFEQADAYLSKYVARRPDDPTGRRLLARIAMRNSNFPRVISLLKPVVDAHPDDSASLALLAQAYFRTGQRNLGVDLYQRAADSERNDPAAKMRLAIAELSAGEREQGQAELEKLAQSGQESDEAGRLLALQYVRNGNLDKAAALAQDLIKRNPKDVITRNLLGIIRTSQLNYPEAEKIFQGIIASDPSLSQPKRNLADVYLATGRAADAEKVLADLLKQQPTDVETMMRLAEVYIAQKQDDKAVDLFAKAKAADPKNPAPGMRLVQLYRARKEWDKAIAAGHAFELQFPDQPIPYDLTATAMVENGDLPGAVAEYGKIVRLRSDNASVLMRYSQFQQGAGDFDGARQSLKHAITVQPGFAAAFDALVALDYKKSGPDAAIATARSFVADQPILGAIVLADTLVKAGRMDAALKTLSDAEQTHPSTGLVVRLAQLTFEAGKAKEAENLLVSWLRDHPQDFWALMALADIYTLENNADKAIATYEAAHKIDPTNPVAVNNLAVLYGRKGDPKGREFAEEAFYLAPSPRTEDTLGWLVARDGEAPEALIFLRRANAELPHDPVIAYHLAYALKANGDANDAKSLLVPLLQAPIAFDGRDDAQHLLKSLQPE